MDCSSQLKTKTSKNKRRLQRYRKAWELFPEFSLWLTSHPDALKSFCRVCNKSFVADLNVIRAHASSRKHLFNETKANKEALPPQEIHLIDMDTVAEVSTSDSGASGTETNYSVSREMGGHFGDTSAASESQFSTQSSFAMQRNQTTQNSEPQILTKAIVTKPAPHWKAIAIVNGHVTRLDLSDYKGRYLILFFYPQDFSKLCSSEINTLSDRIAEFRALSTEIVACSTDSHLCHLAWIRTPRTEGGVGNSKIPILADPTHSITKDYGVYLEDRGHALRAHFVIDRMGVLRYMNVGDMKLGRGTDELLRVIKGLQYTDDTEEGCPADWKPPAD